MLQSPKNDQVLTEGHGYIEDVGVDHEYPPPIFFPDKASGNDGGIMSLHDTAKTMPGWTAIH
jgi:hypothetical protein